MGRPIFNYVWRAVDIARMTDVKKARMHMSLHGALHISSQRRHHWSSLCVVFRRSVEGAVLVVKWSRPGLNTKNQWLKRKQILSSQPVNPLHDSVKRAVLVASEEDNLLFYCFLSTSYETPVLWTFGEARETPLLMVLFAVCALCSHWKPLWQGRHTTLTQWVPVCH